MKQDKENKAAYIDTLMQIYDKESSFLERKVLC